MAISVPASVGTPVNPAGNASTVTLTTNVVIPSNAKVWLVTSWFNAAVSTISTISDGGATSFTQDKIFSNGSCRVGIIQADYASGLASGTTFTVTFGGGVDDRQLAGYYSTGVTSGAVAAYGAIGAADNATTAWHSGNITVTSGDILIGVSKFENGAPQTSTPSGGNTELGDWNNGASGYASTAVYQIGTGAAIQASGTWTGSSAATDGTASAAVAYTAVAGSTPPFRPVVSRLQAVNTAASW